MNGETRNNNSNAETAKKATFALLGALTLSPFVSTGMALAAGIAFSLAFGNPWPKQSARLGKILLQVSVVGLGFGMNIGEVWRVGSSSLIFTALGITFTMACGLLLGHMMGIGKRSSALLSFGTAICGGSAIAAMAPVIDADSDESAVALATVFTLNAVALFVFPPLGHIFGLGQEQFGTWAGMAIHDTSSVVGAAASYGAEALAIGTTVKLSRAIWIAPVALITSMIVRKGGKVRVPLFIVGFIAAAALAGATPQAAPLWHGVAAVAKQSLVLTLFLIGAGLSRPVLRKVGIRPMAQGLALWLIVSLLTLEAVRNGWI